MDKNLLTLIDTAIQREEDAYVFYMALHGRVIDAGVKDTLQWIAGEEQKHRAFLIKYREGGFGQGALRLNDVVYYKIAEHQAEPAVTSWPPTASHARICFMPTWPTSIRPGTYGTCCSKWRTRN
jgi:hypothetical protein